MIGEILWVFSSQYATTTIMPGLDPGAWRSPAYGLAASPITTMLRILISGDMISAV
jgi:hypothetical protein